ncbi:hypothetical protein [Streptomyces sp. NPDC048473]|uniref:hypothetical protein n=1 Tax=unclassified Streptomyces TaxID=2593676 RepID=UPI003714F958
MLERLNRAMEHIECHLDQAVEVEEVARIAATSEYHLRRMFSALAGKPLSDLDVGAGGGQVLAGGAEDH